jgi:predicted RNA-binding protein with RPS1 domain
MDIKYYQGYILSDCPLLKIPKNYILNKFDNLFFYIEQKLNNFFLKDEGGDWICLMGDVIDLNLKTLDLNLIISNLLLELKRSENNFLSYCDNLSGRYVLIYKCQNKIKIFNDAKGFKSVFYSTGKQKIISSHINLLKDNLYKFNLDEEIHNECIKLRRFLAFPGISTDIKEIKILTSNTYLTFEDNSIVRFYPRKNLEAIDLDEAVLKVEEIIESQIELIANKYQTFISLTGGLDSRLTLSCVKNNFIKDVNFFTYKKEQDQLIPLAIKEKLNINLSIINKISEIELKDYHELLKNEEIEYSKDRVKYLISLIKKYNLSYENSSNNRHIQSVAPEIGRKFFHRITSNRFKTTRLSPYVMGILMARALDGSLRRSNENLDYAPKYFIEKYEEFINKTDFNNSYNYDQYELLYLEQRMNSWYSKQLRESDFALPVFPIYSSRKFIDLVLAVQGNFNLNQIKGGLFFINIIKNKNKNLMAFPFFRKKKMDKYYNKYIGL